MRYLDGDDEVKVGDRVLVEGNVSGIVVCDFEKSKCMPGYEEWLEKVELTGGGRLTSGVLIATTDMGLVHYPEEDAAIRRERNP
jgi:hypothetical protein